MSSERSLAGKMRAHGNAVEMLRNSPVAMVPFPVLAPEYTNWRIEHESWRKAAVLQDLSFHMDELVVQGPDAARLLEGLAVNSFTGFTVNKAKHYVPVSPQGYVIGDMIAYREEDDKFLLVGRAPTANWIEFNAKKLGCNVALSRDPRSPGRPDGKKVERVHYRIQIQGPKAKDVLEKLNGGPLPDIKFFNVDWISVGGRKARALRHSMAGAPGLEISGPYADRDEIIAAILEAGAPFGIRQLGARGNPPSTTESGWIPGPLPAIYSGAEFEEYRNWLTDKSYEANTSIGGSFVSDDISDYYTTPQELGYGFYVKFDHDFVGRPALEAMQGKPHRKKVTFEWNPEDVLKVMASAFQVDQDVYKWIEMPNPNYAGHNFDKVMHEDRMVGLSMFAGYSFNERALLSLGIVDPDIQNGDVLTLIWGEEDGGTRKSSVERHRQVPIRVKVSPVPYAREARENYAESWRMKAV